MSQLYNIIGERELANLIGRPISHTKTEIQLLNYSFIIKV